jgi:hypothetical protein
MRRHVGRMQRASTPHATALHVSGGQTGRRKAALSQQVGVMEKLRPQLEACGDDRRLRQRQPDPGADVARVRPSPGAGVGGDEPIVRVPV